MPQRLDSIVAPGPVRLDSLTGSGHAPVRLDSLTSAPVRLDSIAPMSDEQVYQRGQQAIEHYGAVTPAEKVQAIHLGLGQPGLPSVPTEAQTQQSVAQDNSFIENASGAATREITSTGQRLISGVGTTSGIPGATDYAASLRRDTNLPIDERSKGAAVGNLVGGIVAHPEMLAGPIVAGTVGAVEGVGEGRLRASELRDQGQDVSAGQEAKLALGHALVTAVSNAVAAHLLGKTSGVFGEGVKGIVGRTAEQAILGAGVGAGTQAATNVVEGHPVGEGVKSAAIHGGAVQSVFHGVHEGIQALRGGGSQATGAMGTVPEGQITSPVAEAATSNIPTESGIGSQEPLGASTGAPIHPGIEPQPEGMAEVQPSKNQLESSPSLQSQKTPESTPERSVDQPSQKSSRESKAGQRPTAESSRQMKGDKSPLVDSSTRQSGRVPQKADRGVENLQTDVVNQPNPSEDDTGVGSRQALVGSPEQPSVGQLEVGPSPEVTAQSALKQFLVGKPKGFEEAMRSNIEGKDQIGTFVDPSGVTGQDRLKFDAYRELAQSMGYKVDPEVHSPSAFTLTAKIRRVSTPTAPAEISPPGGAIPEVPQETIDRAPSNLLNLPREKPEREVVNYPKQHRLATDRHNMGPEIENRLDRIQWLRGRGLTPGEARAHYEAEVRDKQKFIPETLLADDEIARLEWEKNASDVADNPPAASEKNLSRAIGYLSSRIQHETNPEIRDSIQREVDWYRKLENEKRNELVPATAKKPGDVGEVAASSSSDETPQLKSAVTKGLYGQSLIESSGVGEQKPLFHQPTEAKSITEPIKTSKEAVKPGNTGELFGKGIEGGTGKQAKAYIGEEPPEPKGALQAAKAFTDRVRSGDVLQKISDAGKHLADSANRFSGRMFPTVTRYARQSGEALARYVSSGIHAKVSGDLVAQHIIGEPVNRKSFLGRKLGPKIDPEMDRRLGTALEQDKRDATKDRWVARQIAAKDKIAKAKTPGTRAAAERELGAAKEGAAAVRDVIGPNSPIKTQSEFDRLKTDPEFNAKVEAYKQWQEGEPERNFQLSREIDPKEADLNIKGKHWNARINSIAIDPEAVPDIKNTVRTNGTGNQRNTLLKDSPWAHEFTGAGKAYDVRLSEMIKNTLGRGTEIARWHEATEQMVKDGIAKIGSPLDRPTIAGEKTFPFDLKRRTLLTAGQTIPQDKVLWVRSSAMPEVRQAVNLDSRSFSPTLSAISNAANKISLASATEAMYHVGNQVSALAGSPGTGTVVAPFMRNFMRAWVEAPEATQRIAELARIGSGREPATGIGGRAIAFMDRVTRLTLDEAYTNLVKKGLKPDTETGRRDFTNAAGQYNHRAQHRLISLFRSLGLSPFATAGTNFYSFGIRSLGLSPGGGGATGAMASARMRGELAVRYSAVLAGVGLANYLAFGSFDGGRGVPLGAMRLKDSEDGKIRYFDFLARLPIGRGLRSSGIRPAVEALRSGKSAGAAVDAGATSAGNAALSPFEGPLVRDVSVLLTGHDPSGFELADKPAIGDSTVPGRVKAAIVESNPIAASLLGNKSSKPLLENQLGPFAPQSRTVDDTDATTYLKQVQREKMDGRKEAEPRTPTPQEQRAKDKKDRMTGFQRAMFSASAQDVVKAWGLLESDEKNRYRQQVRRKIVSSKTMSPEQRRAALQTVQ